MHKLPFLLLILLTTVILVSCTNHADRPKGKIIVTGGRYTEQLILTHILGEYLKAKTNLEVTVKEGLGGLYILTEGLKQGMIDLTVAHTGTCYLNVLKQAYSPSKTPEQILHTTKEMYEKQFHITWLKPLGFNNTYALALPRKHADALKIKKISDLVKIAPTLSFGSNSEFYERSDGYDALTSYYHMTFKKKITIDPDLMYEAAKEGEIDVITAYSTDPRIRQMDLKLLIDDKRFFPPYDGVPVIRMDTLQANPGLAETLNELGGILNDKTMMDLNGQVNLSKKDPKDVAIAFLKSKKRIP